MGIFIFDNVEVLDFTGPFEVFSWTRTEKGPESRKNEINAPFKVFTVSKIIKSPNVYIHLNEYDLDVFSIKQIQNKFEKRCLVKKWRANFF